MQKYAFFCVWCSGSFTKRDLVSFSHRNFSHTLNIDQIVTKPEKMDKATQGLHGHKISLRSDKNSRSYRHFNEKGTSRICGHEVSSEHVSLTWYLFVINDDYW